MLRHGIFITLEGIDGTGKTTQARQLVSYLRKRGYGVLATREPGGTEIGEQIRCVLLKGRPAGANRPGGSTRRTERPDTFGAPAPLTELALMYAARAQHLDEVVRPALARGQLVVSDRFNDASMAYQGYGRQLGVETVRAFDRIVCGSTQPDLTIILDLKPRLSLARARGREKRRNSSRGRFEAQGLKFHERVRAGYLAIARRDPRRVKVVRADRAPDEVQREIRQLVHEFLAAVERKRQAKRQRSKARIKNKVSNSP